VIVFIQFCLRENRFHQLTTKLPLCDILLVVQTRRVILRTLGPYINKLPIPGVEQMRIIQSPKLGLDGFSLEPKFTRDTCPIKTDLIRIIVETKYFICAGDGDTEKNAAEAALLNLVLLMAWHYPNHWVKKKANLNQTNETKSFPTHSIHNPASVTQAQSLAFDLRNQLISGLSGDLRSSIPSQPGLGQIRPGDGSEVMSQETTSSASSPRSHSRQEIRSEQSKQTSSEGEEIVKLSEKMFPRRVLDPDPRIDWTLCEIARKYDLAHLINHPLYSVWKKYPLDCIEKCGKQYYDLHPADLEINTFQDGSTISLTTIKFGSRGNRSRVYGAGTTQSESRMAAAAHFIILSCLPS
jgi:hypothetical protein